MRLASFPSTSTPQIQSQLTNPHKNLQESNAPIKHKLKTSKTILPSKKDPFLTLESSHQERFLEASNGRARQERRPRCGDPRLRRWRRRRRRGGRPAPPARRDIWKRRAPAPAEAVAAGGGPPRKEGVRAGGAHGRGPPRRLLPLRGVPRLPRPLPRAPLRRLRGRLAPGARMQEVVGAVVAVSGHVARARRRRAAPRVRVLAQRAAAADGARRSARARALRAGAAHEGRGLRPVEGAAVRGDKGQMLERRGWRVAAAPAVLPEPRHCLSARARGCRCARRQVHPLRLVRSFNFGTTEICQMMNGRELVPA